MKLIKGDCLEEMEKLEDGSIDMVLTDPPYGTTQCKWDTILDLDSIWKELERIVKPSGAIVMTAAQPFTSALVMSNPKMFRYGLVWEKGTATGHLNAKRMPMRAHEDLVVFYKKLPTYHPQKTTGHKPMNPVYADPNKTTDVYGDHVQTDNEKGTTERYPRSVLKFSVVTVGTEHPTQKPVELMEHLVKTYTNLGETVLDFTMGSGTTGVACANLSRYFVGIELDDNYFSIAERRIGEAIRSEWKFLSEKWHIIQDRQGKLDLIR